MSNRPAIAETSMERLAELRGDITKDVLEIYYRRFPDARESFRVHGLGDVAELEGRMVTTTAFNLLTWAQDRPVAMIEQGTTIVHHHDTLLVGPQWYLGMIDAVLEVLFETIPTSATEERALWFRVRAEIADFIDSVRPEFWRPDKDGALPPFSGS
ncbi:hypothetical protein [Parerythrobacter jejuensis]|uniref:Globin n=1 Tax=Parerythrobacter jejuensis TaxID=795812 RepID=A0A845AZD0_9SPHN|nr:hypothetical protein [Parerythrobacter jejuensis]MXP32108.1 hypothetical protein [Parerythrobacter jejuensis]